MQSDIAKYSLVAFPEQSQCETIAYWKKIFGNKIGRYRSNNSKAHITIAEFKDDEAMNFYINRLRSFCKLAVPNSVVFNQFIFGRETFFIAPNDSSKIYVNQMIRALHKHIDKKHVGLSAHISIGRELSPGQIECAREIFTDTIVNVQFMLDTLSLRRFNDQTRQYSDVVEEFKLTGKPQPDLFTI